MNHFRITGLPRCRSAWLANLFTWGRSFCWHENMDGRPSPEGLDHLGISDPALVLRWRQEAKEFPDAKWILIDRNLREDLVESCQRFEPSITEESLMNYRRELMTLYHELNPYVCGFEDIGPFMCSKMSEYLGIDIGPQQRVVQLCDMNIQIHPPILKARLKSLKSKQFVDIDSPIGWSRDTYLQS